MPWRRHIPAKSSSPSEWAPAQTSSTTCRMKGRRPLTRTSVAARSNWAGTTIRCWTDIARMRAACRSLEAQPAARIAATSERVLGKRPCPRPSSSSRRTRCTLTPSTAGHLELRVTDTCTSGSAKPVSPAASRLLTPSRVATSCPTSHTPRASWATAGSGPRCTAMVWAPCTAHRSPATSRATAFLSTPRRARSRRETTPPCPPARSSMRRRTASRTSPDCSDPAEPRRGHPQPRERVCTRRDIRASSHTFGVTRGRRGRRRSG